MTYKNFYVDSQIGIVTINDTYGGKDLQIIASTDLSNMLRWWREWSPVFASQDPTVVDALQQARVLHGISLSSQQ